MKTNGTLPPKDSIVLVSDAEEEIDSSKHRSFRITARQGSRRKRQSISYVDGQLHKRGEEKAIRRNG
jgi:hypothetical protein